ncbi:hypothetical protein MBLNU459_g3732t1 [Dothideomycetes sp. NU459]
MLPPGRTKLRALGAYIKALAPLCLLLSFTTVQSTRNQSLHQTNTNTNTAPTPSNTNNTNNNTTTTTTTNNNNNNNNNINIKMSKLFFSCFSAAAAAASSESEEMPAYLTPMVMCRAPEAVVGCANKFGRNDNFSKDVYGIQIFTQPQKKRSWWRKLALCLGCISDPESENCFSQPLQAPEHPRDRRVPASAPASAPAPAAAMRKPAPQNPKPRRVSFAATHRAQLYDIQAPASALKREDAGEWSHPEDGITPTSSANLGNRVHPKARDKHHSVQDVWATHTHRQDY